MATQELCRRGNSRLAVSIIPLGAYLSKDSFNGLQAVGFEVDEKMLESDGSNNIIHEVCAELKIECLDPTDEFRQLARDSYRNCYFGLDGHFNSGGHEAYAKIITPKIKSLVLDED